MPPGELSGSFVGLGLLLVHLTGVNLGQRPLRADDGAFDFFGRRHTYDVLLDLPGFGRSDLANVGRSRGPGELDGFGGVNDVVLGDPAVALLVDDGAAVGNEPFVGRDDGLGLDVVGVPFGEDGLGLFGVDAGHGGVGEPDGAGVVELLQLLGTAVEGGSQGCGLGRLAV